MYQSTASNGWLRTAMKQPRRAMCNHASFGIPTSTKKQKYPLPNGTRSWAATTNSKHSFKTTFTMELPLWTVSPPQLRPQRRSSKELVLSGKNFALWLTLRPNIMDRKLLVLSSWHIWCVLSFDKGDYLWKDVVFNLGPVERGHCLHADRPGPPHGHVLLSWTMWVSSTKSGSVASQTRWHFKHSCLKTRHVGAAGSRFSTASSMTEQGAGPCWWMASTLLKSSESSRPKTLSFCRAWPSGTSTWRKLDPTATTWWALAPCSAFTLGTMSFTSCGTSTPEHHKTIVQAVQHWDSHLKTVYF